jgi:hypothetical protein
VYAWVPTGLSENGAEGWKVYPNPAKDFIVVEAFMPVTSRSVSVNLYNLDGRIVGNWSMRQDKLVIPTAPLTGGVYFLEISASEGMKQKVLIRIGY